MAEIFPSLNGATYQLPLTARQVLAANMQDASTVEGAALNNTIVAYTGIVVNPSGDTTGSTDAAAANTAMSSLVPFGGGRVTLAPGQWYMNAPYTIPSNVNLHAEGPFNSFLVAGSKCNLVTNTVGVETTTNIALTGRGSVVFDGNGGNQTRLDISPNYAGWRNVGLYFVNVDGLKVDGVTWANTAMFGALMVGVRNARWTNVRCEQDLSVPNQDGLDIGPGCSNVYIDGFSGTLGDDSHSLFAKYTTSNRVVHPLYTPDSYPYKTGPAYWSGPAGALYTPEGNDTHHVWISRSHASTAQHPLRMQAAEGSQLYEIHATDISSTADQCAGLVIFGPMKAAYLTGPQPASDGSDFHSITIDGISGSADWAIKLDSFIRDVTIRGVKIENWDYLIAQSDTSASGAAYNLTIDGLVSNSSGAGTYGSGVVLVSGMVLADSAFKNVRLAAIQRLISNTGSSYSNTNMQVEVDTIANTTPFYTSAASANTGRASIKTGTAPGTWGNPPTLPVGSAAFDSALPATTGFTDSFNRADTATGLGSTDSGTPWASLATSTIFGHIASNAAAPVAGTSGNGYVVADGASTKGALTATISATGANHFGGLVIRGVDNLNAITVETRVSSSDFHYVIKKRVASTSTIIATSSTTVSADGDVVKVEWDDSTITVTVNSSVAVTAAMPTEGATSQKHGMMLSSGNTDFRVDQIAFVAA